MPWYFEELQLGQWCPKLSAQKPKTTSMGSATVLARAESAGGPVRRIREVTEEQAAKGLDYLKAVADVDQAHADDAAKEQEARRVATSS